MLVEYTYCRYVVLITSNIFVIAFSTTLIANHMVQILSLCFYCFYVPFTTFVLFLITLFIVAQAHFFAFFLTIHLNFVFFVIYRISCSKQLFEKVPGNTVIFFSTYTRLVRVSTRIFLVLLPSSA